MGRNAILFALVWGILGFGNAVANNSQIPRPPYETIEHDLINLSEQYPQDVERIVYGTSNNGRNLTMLRIGRLTYPSMGARQAVYISGSTHGNEYLNIEDRLPRYFMENSGELPSFRTFIQNGGIVYIVPILNPDGFTRGHRRNANRIDLNRDFPLQHKNHEGFAEVETRTLIEHLNADLQRSNARLVFTLDYHCCAKALVRPWSFSGESLPQEAIAAHQQVGALMKNIFKGYGFGDTVEMMHEARVGTSKDYFYETYGSLSFTFEGQVRVENQNLPEHVALWEQIFAHLLR